MTMIQTFPAGGGVGVPSGGTKDQALVKNSNTDKDVTWKTITPGHIIEDSAAAATQRDTVQIKGLSISDDSTNQKTVIEGVGLNSDSLDDITSGSVNNIFVQPSMVYTTGETIVGKWIDGKPIYQKVVIVNKNLTAGQGYSYSIPNADTIIQHTMYMSWANMSSPIRRMISDAWSYSSDGWVDIYYQTTNKAVEVRNTPAIGLFYLIIQYTKTTD